LTTVPVFTFGIVVVPVTVIGEAVFVPEPPQPEEMTPRAATSISKGTFFVILNIIRLRAGDDHRQHASDRRVLCSPQASALRTRR
jgi:hypothetical protein